MPNLPHLPVVGLHHAPEPVYTFRLDQYRVTDTRSVHDDTNVVACTLKVGTDSFTQSLPPKDVNNGNHDVCLEFPGIKIDNPATEITIAFAITNAGHDSAAVEAALQKGVDSLIANEAGKASITGTLAMLAVDEGLALLFANCDGAVAADTLTVMRSALDATIPANGRVQTHTKQYPGTDSSAGCGANSNYYVTQTIIRTQVGDVNQPQAGKTFIIAGRSSGLVLDVPGGATTPGVQVQQYPDNGTLAQHWNLIPVDDGYFMIRSVLSGLVLEVAGNSKADHAKIQLAAELSGHNQHWKFEPVAVTEADLPFPVLPNSNPYFRIRSRDSGKVLDVPSRSAEPVGIQQYAAQASDFNNQLWQLLALADAPPEITTGPPQVGTILRARA